ncbi:MAG TPA: NAD-dependent epimerase/dehydratase family protein [Candidatus Acidoferrales bacterium]
MTKLMKEAGPKTQHVTVIGGAGFIGSHLVDRLVRDGYTTRIVDNLEPQVHPGGVAPAYLNPQAEFIRQDVRDREGLVRAIQGTNAIFYLAGAVGVGDSMYKIRHYAEANVLGAANLLDILANEKHAIGKLVLASTVTVYGEGKYSCPRHGIVFPEIRQAGPSSPNGAAQKWDPRCPQEISGAPCPETLTPLPIEESKPLAPLSIYAATKRTQEEMFLTVGRAYGIPVIVLRYFNVYGSRQAVSNPYTGVAKIFAADFARGKAPLLYEDGLQTRDFVHISDVVQANLLALENPQADGEIFNVASGRPTTILEACRAVGRLFPNPVAVEPSRRFRAGDVRHSVADISKIQNCLGFRPQTFFPACIEDVLPGGDSPTAAESSSVAHDAMARRGLIS